MICSFVVGLHPQKEETKKILKYINYDYFKNMMLENEFSKEEVKKIIVSNFLTKDRFFEDKTYYIKISSIDSESVLKFLKLLFFYKITNHFISIQNIDFKIINIYHNGFWAKQFEMEIFQKKSFKKEIEIKILTPIFFKIGNEYRESLEPIYIFKNLISKIKKSSLCDEKLLENIKNFSIEKIRKKREEIHRVYMKKFNVDGVIGKVSFEIESEENSDIFLFNLLLEFSFFSGIGYLTEKGYGQIVLEKI